MSKIIPSFTLQTQYVKEERTYNLYADRVCGLMTSSFTKA